MIAKLTIGRLFSLGNYEHIRYEVAVELSPTDKPSHVLDTIQTSLEVIGKSDAKNSKTLDEVTGLKERLEELKKMTPAEYASGFYDGVVGMPEAEKKQALESAIQEAESALKQASDSVEEAQAALNNAYAALDSLHATVTSKTS